MHLCFVKLKGIGNVHGTCILLPVKDRVCCIMNTCNSFRRIGKDGQKMNKVVLLIS